MTAPGTNASVLERLLAPRLLLLGVASSFLACCLAGRGAGRVNSLQGFTRFHPYLNQESLYYPTVSQVQALARDTLNPDKIIVVVGGNSIMTGCGQGPTTWINHLEALLGKRFQVFNLSLPGGPPFEFGATAAEILSREYPRLILLTNTWPDPSMSPGDPEGSLLTYFFREARLRGLLASNPEREASLRKRDASQDETRRELQTQLRLDGRLHFRDLWNAVTYRRVSPSWCPLVASTWPRPRRAYTDPGLQKAFAPVEECALAASNGTVLPRLRATAARTRLFVLPVVRPGWQEPVSPIETGIRECLPPDLRRRTLLLLNHFCPYYLHHLTAEEQALYSLSFPLTARLYARAGVRAVEVGRPLSVRYYADSVHLTAEGGKRMAAEVAPMVQALARRLGYLRNCAN